MTTTPDDPRDDADEPSAWQAPDAPNTPDVTSGGGASTGDVLGAAEAGAGSAGGPSDEAPAEPADSGPPMPGPMPQSPASDDGSSDEFADPFTAGTPVPAAPSYAPAPTTSTKAIVSLVSSLVFACGIGSAIGVVTGHLARRDIRTSNGRLGGSGIALAGLIIGYIGLAVAVVVAAVAVLVAVNADDIARDLDPGAGNTLPDDEVPPDLDGRFPAAAACPVPADLAPVLPRGVSIALAGAARAPETGVVDCFYLPPNENLADGRYVLVALQDDLARVSVDAYWSERELAPPTPAQLGSAAGSAERFGFDEYPAPEINVPYVDTGAANGDRSVVVSLPESFGVDSPTQFSLTVDLLDDLKVSSPTV